MRPLPRLRLPFQGVEGKSVLLFFIYNTMFYVSNATFGPYLSAHYASLGIDTFLIGILLSIGPLCSIFIVPIWSSVSDKTGRRLFVLKIAIIGSMLSILLFLIFRDFWPLFFTVFIFLAFYTAIMPLGDAITVTYLSRTSYRFSSVRMGGTLGFCAFSSLFGLIISKNANLSFIMGAVTLALLIPLLYKIPNVDVHRQEKKKLDFKRAFKNKKIIFVLFMACTVQIALSCNGAFLGVYIRDLGYGSLEIGNALMVSAFSEIPVLLLIDKVLSFFGVSAVLLFSGLMTTVRMFIVFKAESIGLVYLAQCFHGVSHMALYYSCVTFINDQMEDDLKSTGQSMLVFFQGGVGSILGNVLGGYIARLIGMDNAFMLYGCLVFAVTVVSTTVMLFLHLRKKKNAEK